LFKFPATLKDVAERSSLHAVPAWLMTVPTRQDNATTAQPSQPDDVIESKKAVASSLTCTYERGRGGGEEEKNNGAEHKEEATAAEKRQGQKEIRMERKRHTNDVNAGILRGNDLLLLCQKGTFCFVWIPKARCQQCDNEAFRQKQSY
jgi:hypothetical protein